MADYAARLSEYPNKGVCGLPETNDSVRVMTTKLRRLASMVRESESVVILTGAGISTSAGIPDFRGPKGVWTLEDKSKRQRKAGGGRKQLNSPSVVDADRDDTSGDSEFSASPDPAYERSSSGELVEHERNTHHPDDVGFLAKRKRERQSSLPDNQKRQQQSAFEQARPTYTHRALASLCRKNVIRHCVTQNVDGLHRRAGHPREKLSILHGCIFTEKCDTCSHEHFRRFDVGGVSFKKTGRHCERPDCEGDLRDTILDWEDELPEDEFEAATEHCRTADLVICLGTSLRIEPAASLPLLAKRFVIVNLQVTPKDGKADLIVRGRVDDVMRDLVERLGIEVPSESDKIIESKIASKIDEG